MHEIFTLTTEANLNLHGTDFIGLIDLPMDCSDFEALYWPLKSKLAMERKPCWQPFTQNMRCSILSFSI